MRVLLIKTSSMGDVIHTLPALTDAYKAIPGIKFDWVVEESFAEIPLWHPAVGEVIPVALRRWRKNLFSANTRAGWGALHRRLREQKYDLILDAQGLVKSAFVSLFAKGPSAGLDWGSAREALASLAYRHHHKVNFYQHAIIRMRQLFSLALGYPLPDSPPDCGLNRMQFRLGAEEENYIVFLHGTTWDTKLWPETYWNQLADLAAQAGYRIKIGGASEAEIARAERIAQHCKAVEPATRLSIAQMAKLLSNAKAAVAVDTGFGHLAAALDLPTVSIYGPTNAEYTGALGKHSVHLSAQFPCAPCLSRSCTYRGETTATPACFTTVTPAKVWETVKGLMI